MKLFAAILLLLLPAIALADVSEAEAIAFLKKHAPAIHAKVAPLKTSDPADYRSALDDAKKTAADFAKLEATGDQTATAACLKMYAIDYDAIDVSDAILATADAKEKERLTGKLRGLIDASFEQWAIVEQARIRRVEQELAKLKADLQAAITNREQVVERDTAKLIEESRAFQKTKGQTPKSK